MMQSLAVVEPMKAGGCEESPLDLLGPATMAIDFAVSLDPVVTERFRSAMDAVRTPEISVLPGILDFCSLSPRGEAHRTGETHSTGETHGTGETHRKEETCWTGVPDRMCAGDVTIEPVRVDDEVDAERHDVLISKDVPVGKSVTQSAERVAGEPPRIAEHKVAEPKIAEHKVAEPKIAESKVVERVVSDAPKTVAPYRREEAPVLQRETVLRDAPVRQSETVLRDAPVRQSATALHEAPSFHRTSRVPAPEPVEIIAPVPLPIELPAAAIRHQQSHPVAPADVSRMFVAAAEAVADAILVSSGFAGGEGRIVVRLQPEVLNGSEVQIVAKGGTLTVVVNPATQDVQNIVEANRTQFEQHLAEKVHAWRVSVAVKRGDESDERV